jgi:short-subunit dehydrogenase
MDFAGKHVLVTGASSGIGAALAEEFAKRGAVVGMCARRRDRLESVLARCIMHSPASRAWVTDLADPAEVDRLAATATEELGQIHVLVNNAGIPKRRHISHLSIPTVESVMQINFFAAARLMLSVLPGMVRQGEGHIVNISSVAATLSSPGEAAYVASKAALSSFSESMAIDLWQTGVKILVVYPGVVETELYEVADNDPLLAPIEPITVDEVVKAVLDALDRDLKQVYVPSYFGDIAAQKAANVDRFLQGAADFVADLPHS